MKIFTASEARDACKKGVDDDALAAAIRHINKRIKSIAMSGGCRIFVGAVADDFKVASALSRAEASQLMEGLRNAGYIVDSDHAWPMFSVSWQTDPKEE